jgi:hypothetical protein
MPTQKEWRPIEPDQVHGSACLSLEERLEVELGRERQVIVDGLECHVEIALGSKLVSDSGAKEKG